MSDATQAVVDRIVRAMVEMGNPVEMTHKNGFKPDHIPTDWLHCADREEEIAHCLIEGWSSKSALRDLIHYLLLPGPTPAVHDAVALAELRQIQLTQAGDLVEVLRDHAAEHDNDITAEAASCIEGLAAALASVSAPPGWQPIETAPHEQNVLVGWWYNGEWKCETAMASHGWRRNGISTMSRHGQATHWQPLPAPPAAAVKP